LPAKSWALLATIGEPSFAFGHYLVGLQAHLAGEWRTAAEELDRALALGLPDLLFTKNAARKLAVDAYRAGDSVRVGNAIAVLHGPGMAGTDHLLAEDWSRRLVFDATGRL